MSSGFSMQHPSGSVNLSQPVSKGISLAVDGSVDFPSLTGSVLARFEAGEGIVSTSTVSQWNDYGITGSRGMWFDGTDDSVDLGDGDPLGLHGSGKIEVEVQIYIDGAPSGTEDLFSTFINLSSIGLGVDIQATGKIRVSGRSTGADGFENFITTEVLAAGSHTIKAYADFTNDEFGVSINGQAYETSAATFANAVYTYSGSTLETRIGSNESIGRFFTGRLGQVKVWKDDVLCDHYIGDGNADANWLDNGTGNIGMWFDGTDDVVSLGDVAAFELDDFTFETTVTVEDLGTKRSIWANQLQLASADGKCGIELRFSAANKLEIIMSIADTFEAKLSTATFTTLGEKLNLIFTKSGTGFTLTNNGVAVTMDSNTFTSSVIDYTTGTTKMSSLGGGWNSALATFQSWGAGLNRDATLKNGSGTVIGSWIGDGNADANWEDQVGSADGTVAGSPTRALSTSTGWREANDGTVAGSPKAAVTTSTGWRAANDLPFTVEPNSGSDLKGRECPVATGTQWGEVAYGSSTAQPWIRAMAAKLDATGSTQFLCDQSTTTPGVILETGAGVWAMSVGAAQSSVVAVDTDWHVFVMVADSVGNDQLWLDGVKIVDASSGTSALEGIALFSSDLGASISSSKIACACDVISPTDIPGDVSALCGYLMDKYVR